MFRRHVIKKLSSYIDKQLSEKEKARVESHLKDCRTCSDELLRLRTLSEKLKLWQAPELGDNFDAAVRNKIVAWELEGREVKMKKKNLAILIPSAALAGILVLVFVSQLYVKRGIQGGLVEGTAMQEAYEPYYRESKHVSWPKVIKNVQRQAVDVAKVHAGYGAMRTAENNESFETDETFRMQTKSEVTPRIVVTPTQGSVIVIQPVIPATGEGDKIIRTGTVKLEVQDGKETYNKAAGICQELGGYLSASHFYKDREGRESGTLTMRIPKDKFTTALDRLSALGKLENINTNSRDVAQEYENLQTQLKAAMVVYDKTLEALQKRQTTVPEATRLESELTPILKRIENLKNRIDYLNNAVSFTTIMVIFHEANVSVKTLKESGRLIKESMLTAGIKAVGFLAAAVPVLFLGLVFFVIIAVVLLIIKYLIMRIFKRE